MICFFEFIIKNLNVIYLKVVENKTLILFLSIFYKFLYKNTTVIIEEDSLVDSIINIYKNHIIINYINENKFLRIFIQKLLKMFDSYVNI